jgi:nitrate reductase alpha subunit
MPMGSAGFRWGQEPGKWNLELRDGLDGAEIDPALTFLADHDGIATVRLDDFGEGCVITRSVPVKRIETAGGKTVTVTTVYDLMMAQYGVPRGLAPDESSDDQTRPYTPAWAEKYTGMGREMVVRFAREWGTTAERTRGRCMVIIGAGINHWYHGNLMYRAAMHALMFCGCVGVNGGGLAHYVGQEKLAPGESWSAIAFGKDWYGASRLQNAPSWHYVNTDQWRYEKDFTDYHTVPIDQPPDTLAKGHTIDVQARAVRSGWLPFYPQFNKSPQTLVREAEAAGHRNPDDIVRYAVEELRAGRGRFSIGATDGPENWPRDGVIWRGNALLASAKGHEYFLRHYLGTHSNVIADEVAEDSVKQVAWHEQIPTGKLDLVVALNFRMDHAAL